LLLGHLSDQQIIDLIDPEDFILPDGQRLPLETFLAEIRKAHDEGFFSFNSIADTFTHCFAAPVKDKQGICIATLCIVAPRADAITHYDDYRRVLIDSANGLARRVND
jgi:DNA-binding IclR family transcriptional regulator